MRRGVFVCFACGEWDQHTRLFVGFLSVFDVCNFACGANSDLVSVV